MHDQSDHSTGDQSLAYSWVYTERRLASDIILFGIDDLVPLYALVHLSFRTGNHFPTELWAGRSDYGCLTFRAQPPDAYGEETMTYPYVQIDRLAIKRFCIRYVDSGGTEEVHVDIQDDFDLLTCEPVQDFMDRLCQYKRDR